MLRYADDHQQAQAVIHPDIAVDAISPPVHVAAATQVSLTPVSVFLDPVLLQPADGVGRQTFSLVAQQRGQHLLVITGGDPLQIKPG